MVDINSLLDGQSAVGTARAFSVGALLVGELLSGGARNKSIWKFLHDAPEDRLRSLVVSRVPVEKT
jgi:hypothetical protein